MLRFRCRDEWKDGRGVMARGAYRWRDGGRRVLTGRGMEMAG